MDGLLIVGKISNSLRTFYDRKALDRFCFFDCHKIDSILEDSEGELLEQADFSIRRCCVTNQIHIGRNRAQNRRAVPKGSQSRAYWDQPGSEGIFWLLVAFEMQYE